MPYLPSGAPLPPHADNPTIRPTLRAYARVSRTLRSIDATRNLQNQLDQQRTPCSPNYSPWQLDPLGNPVTAAQEAVPAEYVALAAQRGTPGLTAAQLYEVAQAPQMVNESEVKPCIPIVKEKAPAPGSTSAPPWGNVQVNPRGEATPPVQSSSWLADNWKMIMLAIVGGIALKSVLSDERA